MTLTAPPAVAAMAARLTAPFARGSDLVRLTLAEGGSPDVIVVAPYDAQIGEHLSRFDRDPVASYVVEAIDDVPAGTSLVASWTSPAATTTASIAASLVPGDGVALPLPAGADVTTRLASLQELTLRPAATAAVTRYRAAALLGEIARLLWAMAREPDRIRAVLPVLRAQRTAALAAGAGLDHLGADLYVPRFPPMAYSVDAATVALYHFDDASAVTDYVNGFPGHTPHPGTLSGPAVLSTIGRFAGGLRLDATGRVQIASSADFDIATGAGFTVECFLRPDPAAAGGFVVSRGDPATTGWAIELSGGGANPALAVTGAVGDGAGTVSVVSGASLPTARFTHVALTLDRGDALLRLFIDGAEVARADASALGAVAPAAPVLIGTAAAGFAGWVDEVRVSGAARSDFAPALGEADDRYRARLRLFRRWLLPTPEAIRDQLNSMVATVGGVASPFVITDADDPLERGRQLLRVVPATLLRGEHLDRDGSADTTPAELWSSDVDSFDPVLCGHHHNPALVYDPPVADPARDLSLLPPDPTLMQPPVARALDVLVELAAADGLPPLHVAAGFDQAADDDRSSARAVLLATQPGAATERLAALAHRAGFDYVEFRHDGTVYAACAPGRQLLVGPASASADLLAGVPVELTAGTPQDFVFAHTTATYTQAAPDLTVELEWHSVDGSLGRVTLAPLTVVPPAVAPQNVRTVTGTAAGDVLVSVDLMRGGHTQTVGVAVVVQPAPLADGETVGADGAPGITTDALGDPEPTFETAYLIAVTDPLVTIDAGVSPLMQQATLAQLEALVAALHALGQDGLHLTGGYDASAGPATLARRGRMLRLRHPSIGNDQLAVHAHRAGFAYVERADPDVVVATDLADLAQISIAAPGTDAVEIGAEITLSVHPKPSDVSATVRLGWSSGQVLSPDDSGVALGAVSPPAVDSEQIVVQGVTPGVAWVQATLRELDAHGPFAFTVDFSAAVTGGGAKTPLVDYYLPLEDYYLVMNALHALCPLGVEIRTEKIRAAVVELNPPYASAEVDPSFTYPQFRLHRAAATLRKEPSDG